MAVRKIGIASDHAGYDYRLEIKKFLASEGYEVTDFGVEEKKAVSGWKIVEDLASAVLDNTVEMGILICGTGIAVSIAANKVRGIRAALCNDLYTARKSREDNDSNVLAFGSRVIGLEVAKEIVKIWLNTEYEGGRHIERNRYIDYIESKNL